MLASLRVWLQERIADLLALNAEVNRLHAEHKATASITYYSSSGELADPRDVADETEWGTAG